MLMLPMHPMFNGRHQVDCAGENLIALRIFRAQRAARALKVCAYTIYADTSASHCAAI